MGARWRAGEAWLLLILHHLLLQQVCLTDITFKHKATFGCFSFLVFD